MDLQSLGEFTQRYLKEEEERINILNVVGLECQKGFCETRNEQCRATQIGALNVTSGEVLISLGLLNSFTVTAPTLTNSEKPTQIQSVIPI